MQKQCRCLIRPENFSSSGLCCLPCRWENTIRWLHCTWPNIRVWSIGSCYACHRNFIIRELVSFLVPNAHRMTVRMNLIIKWDPDYVCARKNCGSSQRCKGRIPNPKSYRPIGQCVCLYQLPLSAAQYNILWLYAAALQPHDLSSRSHSWAGSLSELR